MNDEVALTEQQRNRLTCIILGHQWKRSIREIKSGLSGVVRVVVQYSYCERCGKDGRDPD